MRQLVTAAAAAILVGGAASAQDLALVIGNENYRDLPEVPGGNHLRTLVERLEGAGFEVIAEADATRAETREAVARFLERAPEAERLLVVLAGHFVRTDRDLFLLPVNGEEPSLEALPRRALPVSLLSTALDDLPEGRAVLVLGEGGRRGEASPYVERGLGALPEAPGHAAIGGDARAALPFARERLAVPGARVEAEDARARGLSLAGLEDALTFVPADRAPSDAPAPTGSPGATAEPSPEREAWEMTRAVDTERGYVAFLDRFPDGAFADDAARRLDALRRDPNARAREEEDELNLDREARRGVQAGLSVLGFDPRGIDGVFGPGTRAAIEAWQGAEGFEPTGFVTAEQIVRLSERATRRAAEIEAEAEAERAEGRRLDEAFWAETGEGGGEDGLRAYLDRYPDGAFADRARERLAALETEAREGAALADARDWDEARAADEPEAYRRYLESHPQGAFAEAARGRLAELRGRAEVEAGREAGEATEAALGLNPVLRGLVEGRLEAFGFEPGAVDGRFDDETRRAIRRYQRSRGLEPSGYLDQGAVAQLLADSFLQQ